MSFEIKLDKKVIQGFKKDLDRLVEVVSSSELNLHRAKSYREYTIRVVDEGTLNIRPTGTLTRYLTDDHQAESHTGGLLKAMEIKPSGKKNAEAGYFNKSKKVPDQRGKDKNLTYTQLAIIQHTGCRIPLQGDSGERVRGYFAHPDRKIYFKKDKQWLIVPPRPFMMRAMRGYLANDLDSKAAAEFIEKELSKS